jgi:RNA polymerase sigma-70 factor (ECF subfamily)
MEARAMPPTPDSRTDTFIELFAESRQALHRYIRRFVRSSETAKEIVQEAFLRTYRERESAITPRAFLFSTARNLAANEIRHRRAVERDTLDPTAELRVAAEHESLEAAFLRDERNRLIQQAIDRLPPQCRAAFTLRIFHECSYKEVADRLGISVKTVEKHISRGMRATNRYLQIQYSVTRRHHG